MGILGSVLGAVELGPESRLDRVADPLPTNFI